MPADPLPEEILALLLAEPATAGQPPRLATAVVRDPHGGGLLLQSVVPSRALLARARVAARSNDGTPIVDPVTREVIGYELSPLAVA